MIDFAYVLSVKYPKDEWILDGEDYSSLTWLSETPKPSENDLINAYDLIKQKIVDDKAAKDAAKAALLAKLGITADEAALLLG